MLAFQVADVFANMPARRHHYRVLGFDCHLLQEPPQVRSAHRPLRQSLTHSSGDRNRCAGGYQDRRQLRRESVRDQPQCRLLSPHQQAPELSSPTFPQRRYSQHRDLSADTDRGARPAFQLHQACNVAGTTRKSESLWSCFGFGCVFTELWPCR
ncbi:hypothetical protein PybrP1_003814 [[Pythium] brassicae (nom. inval.)]|nr:hypothetical protein PybrP1_003814 [[Pythium] brassicae (nom. inval.)]